MKNQKLLPSIHKVIKLLPLVSSRYKKLSVIALLIFLLASNSGRAQLIYGLSGNNLISFNASNPAVLLSSTPISGITSGQTIEGMDFRPLTGKLYALGYNKSNMQYQIYIIDLSNGNATAVNSPGTLNLGPAPTPPSKLQIGFDFNPTVDRIRVVSTKDFNYRLNPNDGSISATDLKLNYAIGDIAEGINPNVCAVAYSNSYAGATSTTLYDFDSRLRSLSIQNPPNNGTLTTIDVTGINLNSGDPTGDLDIFFDPVTFTNKAYLNANMNMNTNDKLYSVNLATAQVNPIGLIGGGLPVKNIAVFIDRTLPAVTGNLLYLLTTNNNLLTIDSDNPSIVRTQIAVTGITLNQAIVGMDFRPATGELVALGYNSTTSESQVYKVNSTTGVATAVNITPTILSLGGTLVGMDFNPTVDRIRVVSTNNANLRLDPNTGLISGTDTNLNYDSLDVNFGVDPTVNAVAYTNSFAGSTVTSLYDYDYALNILANQNPPNEGDLLTVGSSGITVNTTDPSIDLDIYSQMLANVNIAYLVANTGTSINDNLYRIDLTTGAASLSGMIGFGASVKNIAAGLGSGLKLTDESSSINTLKVYPNPVSEVLTIQLNTNVEATVELFDMNGRKVMAATENVDGNYEINVSSLSGGVYMIRATAEGNTMTQKIVVK